MSYIIDLQLNPQDIAMLDKIFEAYNNLALVSTIDRKKGLVKINATPQTVGDVREILNNLPIEVIFL